MNTYIQLYLPDLDNSKIWTHNVEYYLTGELKGYISGQLEILTGARPYRAEFLFRVHDLANGNDNTMVSFSETPTADQKPEVDKASELLTMQLVWWSNMCKLINALGVEIPECVYSLEIKEDNAHKLPEYWFTINGDCGYILKDWTIADAIAEYDTEEAKIERDIFVRQCWGFYD